MGSRRLDWISWGLLGVGGSNTIVPALVGLSFDPKKASASTYFVVIFSSLSGFLGHLTLVGMNYGLIGWTAAGSAAGALFGSWLVTDKLKGRQVKMLNGIVLLAIAARMAWDCYDAFAFHSVAAKCPRTTASNLSAPTGD